MCGISGVIKNKFSKIDLKESIFKILNLQNHRGPDKSDLIKLNENLIFGHNRLSIQDLSEKGNQPMFSQNNNLLITFNGEIYNHMKLRNTFVNQDWKSTCDTETIVNLIEKNGIISALNLIEGMFAFACYNQKEQKIYLARDRFGEKPLYYYNDNNFFAFASEIFPLTQIDGINKKINENSILNFLKYSYIGSPNSIYKKISKLNAGCVLEINLLNFLKGQEYFKIYRWTQLSKIVENSKNNIITNFNEAKKS